MNRAEQLRLDAGLSREELATQAQVSWRTVKRLEDGETVGAGRMFTIARALSEVQPGAVTAVRPSELQLPAFSAASGEAA